MIPKKFTNLHGHSNLSVGDAIGSPQEHIEFAIKNNSNSISLTDHGNMNSFAGAWIYYKKLKNKGVNFKFIPGLEAYFVPSLNEWRHAKTEQDKKKYKEKELAKQNKKQSKKENFEDVGNPFLESEKELDDIIQANIAAENEGESGTIVENEEESKQAKSWLDPVKRRNHLVLLAKNNAGLKTLFKLTSRSFLEGFYKYPRIDFKMLKEEAKGNIIASTACLASPVNHIISKWQPEGSHFDSWVPNDDNFEQIQKELKDLIDEFKDALGPENFYLELQWNSLNPQHLLNYHLIEASKRTNTPLICTADSHYANPDHWREREIYKAMAWMSKTKGEFDLSKIPQKIDELKCELYPKNAKQMWESYIKYGKSKYDFYDDQLIKEAIERTSLIAHEQIEEISPDTSVKLPSIKKIVHKDRLQQYLDELDIGSKNEDDIAFKELVILAKEGLLWRGKAEEQNYIDRLLHELKVIKHLKLAKYFITYHKIMEIIGSQMLTGPGRGSASGSLVCYCLNVTQLDPIEHNLLFERFLVYQKHGAADIDSDCSDRDKAVKLLTEYFDKENVVPVTNFNLLQLRSLIKDLARINGLPFDEINNYTNKIEKEALAFAKQTPGFDRQQWVLTYDEAEQNSPSFRELMQKYPDFEKSVRVLFKQMRSISRHAGGCIITDNTKENMPLIMTKGELQTPWTEGLAARQLEEFGFLKFDILGLGTLRIFENCIKCILQKKTNKKYISFQEIKQWYYENLHPDNNKMDDMNVYKHVFWNKNFVGIFQFVNPRVQDFISQYRPTCLYDLSVITAAFRPGPLSLSIDKILLKRRHGKEKITYKHPLEKEVLERSMGTLIFQEQTQLLYHKLAGIPLDETDAIRKALTKKDLSNKDKAEAERKRLKNEFVDKCNKNNNIDEKTSSEIFKDIEAFVAYSFNYSHSLSYCAISFQCAYLLTYYPEEWVTSYIDYCSTDKGKGSGEDPRLVAITEAKALGFEIGKPDINLSQKDYSSINKKLIPSFSSLKSIGSAAINEINDYRPYNKLEDLLLNSDGSWRHSKFNKRSLENLIKLEALDSMNLVGPDKPFKNYKQLHYVLIENYDEIKRVSQLKKNNNWRALVEKLTEEAQTIADWNRKEKIEFSKELSGSVDINLVLPTEILNYIKRYKIKSIDQYENDQEYVWCIVKNCIPAKTKTNKDYLKIKVYAENGTEYMLYCWNYNSQNDTVLEEYTVIFARIKKSDFGYSVFYNGIELLMGNHRSKISNTK